jgi:hypothetical protein
MRVVVRDSSPWIFAHAKISWPWNGHVGCPPATGELNRLIPDFGRDRVIRQQSLVQFIRQQHAQVLERYRGIPAAPEATAPESITVVRASTPRMPSNSRQAEPRRQDPLHHEPPDERMQHTHGYRRLRPGSSLASNVRSHSAPNS